MLRIKPRILELRTYFPYAVLPLFMVSDRELFFIWALIRADSHTGRLADILGRKGAMLLALSLFGVLLSGSECIGYGVN